jgi:hypothetical protein
MTLPLPEAIADRLQKGYLRQVNPDGSPVDEVAAKTRPAAASPKAEWVGWAVHNGMTPDDAEAMTKADLVEKFSPAKTGVSVDAGSDEAKQVGDAFFAPADEPN